MDPKLPHVIPTFATYLRSNTTLTPEANQYMHALSSTFVKEIFCEVLKEKDWSEAERQNRSIKPYEVWGAVRKITELKPIVERIEKNMGEKITSPDALTTNWVDIKQGAMEGEETPMNALFFEEN
eukprot:TRINITY_DN523_c0_g1_i6.p1 TRINITY_DN523_c0_g1~~TRINITY_DN523_c0_g1_i6.p1  ORF type:complete len:125 (-),score=26.67 TRINITY_DN523_c0_g1_i6:167-541(-)